MSKRLLWLIILCLVVVIVRLLIAPEKKQPDYEELIRYINFLNNEVHYLELERDSLYSVIDSSKSRINIIERWYEKELIDITNQPVADDVVFFSEYLSEIGK